MNILKLINKYLIIIILAHINFSYSSEKIEQNFNDDSVQNKICHLETLNDAPLSIMLNSLPVADVISFSSSCKTYRKKIFVKNSIYGSIEKPPLYYLKTMDNEKFTKSNLVVQKNFVGTVENIKAWNHYLEVHPSNICIYKLICQNINDPRIALFKSNICKYLFKIEFPKDLTHLNLSYINFGENITHLRLPLNLQSLLMQANNLGQNACKIILPINLQIFNLKYDNIGKNLANFQWPQQLKKLYLENTNIEKGINKLMLPPSLEHLSLRDNNIGEYIYLLKLPKGLIWLHLENNNIKENLDKFLLPEELEYLYLDYNNIGENIYKLQLPHRLEILGLQCNNIHNNNELQAYLPQNLIVNF